MQHHAMLWPNFPIQVNPTPLEDDDVKTGYDQTVPPQPKPQPQPKPKDD